MRKKSSNCVEGDQVDPGACGKALQSVPHHQIRAPVCSLQRESEQGESKQHKNAEYGLPFCIPLPGTAKQKIERKYDENNRNKFDNISDQYKVSPDVNAWEHIKRSAIPEKAPHRNGQTPG